MMTKEHFLNELNRELKPLNKRERKKYLCDYEEMIFDKMEDGISEESAVAGLGGVKDIAKDILTSYTEADEEFPKEGMKKFNHILVIYGVAASILSAALAYYLHFKREIFGTAYFGNRDDFPNYFLAFLFFVCCNFVFYYLLRLYTTKYGKKPLRILGANALGLIAVFFLLFLTKQLDISRSMLVVSACINTILGIAGQNVIFYLFRKKV